MACFVAPMAEAIVTTVVMKAVKKKEKRAEKQGTAVKTEQMGISWSRKLAWLNKLLWGGTMLLAFEHFWHGEIVLRPPFLTAIENPSGIAPMLQEMVTTGAEMAIFVTVIWLIMIAIANQKAKAVHAAKADMAQ
jgi:hypothetical protein